MATHPSSDSINSAAAHESLDENSVTPQKDHHHKPSQDDSAGPCFFADATLDLEEAHGIADTPVQGAAKVMSGEMAAKVIMEMPTLNMPNLNTETPVDMNTINNDAGNTVTPMNNTEKEPPTITNQEGRTATTDNNNNANNSNDFSSREPTLLQGGSMPSAATQPTYRPKPPRRPRDPAWAAAAVFFIPASLALPLVMSKQPGHWAGSSQATRATIWSILIAFGAALTLSRFLYRTAGGGDGEEGRYLASQIILTCASIAAIFHPLLILMVYVHTPDAFAWALIPLVCLIRLLLYYGSEGLLIGSFIADHGNSSGRHVFFRALVDMALDLLSRSLRRASFYRVLIGVLMLQFFVICFWRTALLTALSRSSTFVGKLILLITLIGGKWATGTVARVLGLIAAGGITSWFAQQTQLIEEMEQAQGGPDSKNTATIEVPSLTGRAALYAMPEAYRTADASAYQSVLDLDDGLDDDYFDEDSFVGDETPPPQNGVAAARSEWSGSGRSTVKAFLISATTVSFGSVAQCGLLGGLAQFLWGSVRNVDAAAMMLSRRAGFRGMQVGEGVESAITQYMTKMVLFLKTFVRGHSDLALSHVAAYYKNYVHAANDVSALVDASGVEPILHEDISTHMCASVCTAFSGVILLVVGSTTASHRGELEDRELCILFLFTFFLTYTIFFTLMEPLRASIKAIYVCFAQHPRSLSQAFPLIYHRLTRISQDNIA